MRQLEEALVGEHVYALGEVAVGIYEPGDIDVRELLYLVFVEMRQESLRCEIYVTDLEYVWVALSLQHVYQLLCFFNPIIFLLSGEPIGKPDLLLHFLQLKSMRTKNKRSEHRRLAAASVSECKHYLLVLHFFQHREDVA